MSDNMNLLLQPYQLAITTGWHCSKEHEPVVAQGLAVSQRTARRPDEFTPASRPAWRGGEDVVEDALVDTEATSRCTSCCPACRGGPGPPYA
jgi:hypothetical protein